ncbi:MAG: FAD-dependent oxidoreductase [Pseudomonadota bacterium]
MNDAHRPRVTIVGAGIAGLTAAWKLINAGIEVELYESNSHVGGKFGATSSGPRFHEHAYHFLADWCVNFWDLSRAIGVGSDRYTARTGYQFLRKGQFPATSALSNLSSPQQGWNNIYSGVMPWYEILIYLHSMLDLLVENLHDDVTRRRFLNRISVNGFVASRRYATNASALLHQNVLLRAFAAPSYRTSARTYRNFLKYAFGSPSPHFRILRTDSESGFFSPFLAALRRKSDEQNIPFTIKSNTRLTGFTLDDSAGPPRVTHIHLANRDSVVSQPVDSVIVAIPHHALFDVIKEDTAFYRAAPDLFAIANLNSRPLASLDLCFNRRLEGIGDEHVTLIDDDCSESHGFRSRFSLSFVDNAQLWDQSTTPFNTTALNVVASDFESLMHLPESVAAQIIVDEFAKYVPFTPRDIDWDATHFQSNVDAPLFLNEVGSWDSRPTTKTALTNLFLAGDYCRTDADIVSLEGAVESGIRAAHLSSTRLATTAPIATSSPPKPLPEVDFDSVFALRRLLAPWVAAAKRASDNAAH